MNRIPVFEREVQSKMIQIDDSWRVEHLLKNLKAKAGDELKLTFIGGRGLGTGRLESLCSEKALFSFDPQTLVKAPQAGIVLLLGLCRPPSMQKILEHGSALGVSHFIFTPTILCEKSFLKSRKLEEKTREHRMLLGIVQGGQYDEIPRFTLAPNFSTALEEFCQSTDLRFFGELDSQMDLFGAATSRVQTTLKAGFALGPERGFTLEEEDQLRKSNCQGVLLHQGIQRIEIATFLALGQWELVRKALTKHSSLNSMNNT